MIGQRIGAYRIVSFLGAGGMGEVYRARDDKLGRDVAIKVLHSTFTSDPDRLSRFEREARALAALNHPCIAAIYGYEQVDDIRALVLELVEGPTLAEQITAGVLAEKDALAVASQIAEALEAAHEKGIIHRDLKPANIKLAPDGRVKVLDFGLAKTFEEGTAPGLSQTATVTAGPTHAGVILGTAAYMSPEQTRGKPVDKRTDIWAFGCVLYEMLTGRMAFPGETMSDVIAGILERDPKWDALPSKTLPRIRHLLSRCLQKDHRHRLRDIGEARVELQGALEAPASYEAAVTPISRRFSMKPRMGVAALLLAAAVATWIGIGRLVSGGSKGSEGRLSDGNRASQNAEANEYYEKALLFGGSGTGEPQQGGRMIERALALDPKFAAARAEYAFYQFVAILNGRSNDAALFYKAESEVRQALQDDPRCGRAHSVLAGVYLLQGRKDLVPGEVDLALRENPDDLTAHDWLVQYHRLNGDLQPAREQADVMIKRWPLFWPGHLQLGELLREHGDAAGAIRQQERVLEQDSQNVDALAALTHAYLESGDLQKARQTLDRARDGDRQNYGLREQRALLLALEDKKGRSVPGNGQRARDVCRNPNLRPGIGGRVLRRDGRR